MQLDRIVVLGVLAFSVYLAWGYFRGGARGIPLYGISLVVVASLLGAAGAELLGLSGAVEALNLAAIALSTAALASSPGLWEDQLRTDLQRTRLFQAMRPEDFLSWQGWLKGVDRLGATRAALAYLSVFAVATGGDLVVQWLARPGTDSGLFLIALVAPCLFGSLSALWLYRGARRLIPGA